MSGRGWVNSSEIRYRVETVESPSTTYVLVGEGDPRGTNDGSFVEGYESNWVDWPAGRHGMRMPINFMDGHNEIYFFKEKATTQISSFYSSTGYSDRMEFIDMGHPQR